ncbi:rRNA processing protein Ipi1 [Schizosaccharomyces cryophilus OY26]|uniref:Pre-rRNA-processing protein n=1 Tax=Schizosaccharomyces cryophilus (strain OY26 / ATCC MYA-4695 / CBS 11777 / NBRC 106824 / NRRL Y48691) TaxID=653667 RepID=S9WYS5_SCHCR|nr:rRNA processing protein Ipi1 [Schizosaccharomyces cryophilus OY26]EPY49827.1 rRNA processing protein Ipi1 [Schizosaccharomyces cryophilus OY26]
MGKSKKAKAKRADFNKQKLKVGKSKQLPNNFTDTSFRSKTLVLPTQATIEKEEFTHDAKDRAQFSHLIGMLKHHNASQRQESLDKLSHYVLSHPGLLTMSTSLLAKVTAPLILDESAQVRESLYQFFVKVMFTIDPNLLEPNVGIMFLYTHSGMTHITPSIRNDSTRYLSLILKACRNNLNPSVISLHWKKTLECFSSLLGWSSDTASVKRTSVFSKKSTSNLIRHISVCSEFLHLGLDPNRQSKTARSAIHLDYPYMEHNIVVHPQFDLLRTPSSFSYLSLFSASKHDLVDNPQFRFQNMVPFIPGLLDFVRDAWSDACPILKDSRTSSGSSKICLSVISILDILMTYIFTSSVEEDKLKKKYTKVFEKVDRELGLLQVNFGAEQEWKSIINQFQRLKKKIEDLEEE